MSQKGCKHNWVWSSDRNHINAEHCTLCKIEAERDKYMSVLEALQQLIDAGFEVWCGPELLPADSKRKGTYFAETRQASHDEGPERTIWADTIGEAILQLAAKQLR